MIDTTSELSWRWFNDERLITMWNLKYVNELFIVLHYHLHAVENVDSLGNAGIPNDDIFHYTVHFKNHTC